jgi:hypothetical protein
MPICFVVQESPGKNLLPARDFGEIRVLLTTSDVRKGVVHCQQILEDKIADFRCDQDFLILVGDPVLMGIAMILCSEMSEGDFQILRWDREAYKYDPIEIRIHNNE